MHIFCDGSGNNGVGVSGYCVILKHPDHDLIEHRVFDTLFTNNEMEWHAMVCAIALASPGDLIHSDSQLVVNQVLRRWKINEPRLLEFAKRAWALLDKTHGISIKWVRREVNDAGIYLEKVSKEAIEAARSPLPPELLPATEAEQNYSTLSCEEIGGRLRALGDELARGNLEALKKERSFLLSLACPPQVT